MRDPAAARGLPPEWRAAVDAAARAEELGAERLRDALSSAPEPAAELELAREWEALLHALGEGLAGLAFSPPLAAAFLSAGWAEFERLADLAEGAPPPAEARERFRLAALEVTDEERVFAVADGLRAVARQCAARGDLTPLVEWGWRPRPPLVPPPAMPGPAPPVPPAPPMSAPAPAPAPEPAPPARAAAPQTPAPAPSPVSAPAPSPALAPAPPAPMPPVARRPAGEILLLCRPTLARAFLERQLAAAGFPLQVADNPEEAVSLLSRGRFRAILAEPELVITGLWPWAEHAGVARIVHLVPGAILGGSSRAEDVLGMPPTEEEMERLRRGL
jgi:hypothetical protein